MSRRIFSGYELICFVQTLITEIRQRFILYTNGLDYLKMQINNIKNNLFSTKIKIGHLVKSRSYNCLELIIFAQNRNIKTGSITNKLQLKLYCVKNIIYPAEVVFQCNLILHVITMNCTYVVPVNAEYMLQARYLYVRINTKQTIYSHDDKA